MPRIRAERTGFSLKRFQAGSASVESLSGAAASLRWVCPPPPRRRFSFEEQDEVCLVMLYLESLNKPVRPWQTMAHLRHWGSS